MKCDIVSARNFTDSDRNTSWTVQKETWLNFRMKATTFGATSSLFFLFHEHDISSSGSMARKMGMSNRVSWEASSSGVKDRGSKQEEEEGLESEDTVEEEEAEG